MLYGYQVEYKRLNIVLRSIESLLQSKTVSYTQLK